MDSNAKKIVIAVLSIIFVIVVAAGIYKNRFIFESGKTVSCNPVFSTKENKLVFLRLYLDSDDKHAVKQISKADFVIVDFRFKSKKTLFTLVAKPREDFRIVSFSDKELIYDRIDFSANKTERYIYSFASQVSYLKTIIAPEFPLYEVDSKNSSRSVSSEYHKNGTSSLLYNKTEAEPVTIMSTQADADYFHSAKWLGNAILFQFHTVSGMSFVDSLWIYYPETTQLLKIEDNCTSFIVSEHASMIACLVPVKNAGKEEWEISVKKIEADKEPELISNEIYKENIFLYDWSPSLNGFVFQAGNSLNYYDAVSMSVKNIMNAEKEGYWGIPLSSYYTRFSSDGQSLAILAYKKYDDKKWKEELIVFRFKTMVKHIIYEQELDALSEKIPFKQDFYNHVVWSFSDENLAFESIDSSVPIVKRIIYLFADGKRKKKL